MNDGFDPYKTPESQLVDIPADTPIIDEQVLASRWRRLFASLVDVFLQMLLTFPVMFYLGIWEAAMEGYSMSFNQEVGFAVYGFVVFFLLNAYLLKKYGQSIGKKALGIRIVTMDGDLPEFNRLILLRILPLWLVSYIPTVGGFLAIADSLFVFRKDRRCIHDLIAGTKVVNV